VTDQKDPLNAGAGPQLCCLKMLQLLASLEMRAEVTCVALLDFTAVVEDREEAQIGSRASSPISFWFAPRIGLAAWTSKWRLRCCVLARLRRRSCQPVPQGHITPDLALGVFICRFVRRTVDPRRSSWIDCVLHTVWLVAVRPKSLRSVATRGGRAGSASTYSAASCWCRDDEPHKGSGPMRYVHRVTTMSSRRVSSSLSDDRSQASSPQLRGSGVIKQAVGVHPMRADVVQGFSMASRAGVSMQGRWVLTKLPDNEDVWEEVRSAQDSIVRIYVRAVFEEALFASPSEPCCEPHGNHLQDTAAMAW